MAIAANNSHPDKRSIWRQFAPDSMSPCKAGRLIVAATRMAVVLANAHTDPTARLACHLGSVPAAIAFSELMAEVGLAWPEPFLIRPPCCPEASPDELLLAAMIATARSANRSGFDALLRDMISVEARARLFDRCVRFAGAWRE